MQCPDCLKQFMAHSYHDTKRCLSCQKKRCENCTSPLPLFTFINARGEEFPWCVSCRAHHLGINPKKLGPKRRLHLPPGKFYET